ncbi:MAG: hypothetical protein LIO68_09240 [Rikenellaceae bacterium]|nr:hypothetical protein [Rikenellaceae bacterium]
MRPGTVTDISGFYFAGSQSDWTFPHNDDLWQDLTKTLFDPCPAGWRVPRSGEVAGGRNPWGFFTADNSSWSETTAALAGRRWTFPESNGGDDWYPLTPRRYYTSGNFQLETGFCHTTTISSETPTSGRHFVYSKEWVHNFESHSRAHGHSVRCVRE